MTFSYYPGCTLRTKALELDKSARAAAKALGIDLQEIPDWQCCGGVYPMAKDEIATKLSSVRTLASARDAGNDLVTICSACHNVLKQVNNDMATNEDIATRANNYMKLDTPYNGETKVIHYLEMLRDVVGFDKIAERIYKFEEVESVYLMSGGFDLTVIIQGKTMREVSNFVSSKLAPMEAVLSTTTHFVLKKYKEHGMSLVQDVESDERMLVTP